MKEDEIRKYAECGMCGNKIGNAYIPMFFMIEVQSFIFNHKNLQQHTGLEMLLGGGSAGAVLAGVMGPNLDLADESSDKIKVSICWSCCENVNLGKIISDYKVKKEKDDEK